MTADRFKPCRAGILNLWHYNDQVLRFEDGRLVLRGANGSGKTKALEVLYPLVLDGRLDPRRLDPFSGSARTMKDNLLVDDRKTEYGYVWMAFERVSTGERVSVGVGMRAKHDRSEVDSWFFVAEGLVGEDFTLVDGERRPLSKASLEKVLAHGSVVSTAVEHRRRVDARLFGLGETRYEALLELILTLRRPKLAADLDPDQVSKVLTQGLRPLPDELIEQAARAFEDLEGHRQRLNDLRRASQTLDELNTAHRTYVRTHAAARLARWQEASQRLDQHQLGIVQLDQLVQAARAQAAAASTAAREAEGERQQADANIRAIEQSDLYRQAADLDDLRKHVKTLRLAADRAREVERAALARLQQAQRQRSERVAERDRLHERVDQQRVLWSQQAAGAQLPVEVDWERSTTDELLRQMLAGVRAREAEVSELQELVRAWTEAKGRLSVAEARLGQAERAHEAAVAELAAVERALRQAREAALDGLLGWRDAVGPEPGLYEALVQRLSEGGWAEASELRAVVQEAVRPQEQVLSELRAGLGQERRGLEAEQHKLGEQLRQLDAAQEALPPASPFRTADRTGRPGAPLWRLVDFQPGVPEERRAALEGALLGAGLLDAWLSPDGELFEQDAALRAGAPVAGSTLADVLRAEAQDRVPVALVTAVLRTIPLDQEAAVAVYQDGRAALGPLRVHYRDERARYIGATARADERRRRRQELERQRERVRQQLGLVQQAEHVLAGWARQLEAFVARLPDLSSLRAAFDRVPRAEAGVELAGRALAEARRARDVAQNEAAEAHRAAIALGRRASLPLELGKLKAFAGRLRQLETDGRALAALLGQAEGAVRRAREAEEAVERALEEHSANEATAEEAAVEHQVELARLEALERSLGDEAQKMRAELDRFRAELRQAGQRAKQEEQRRQGAQSEADKLDGRVTTQREQVQALTAELGGLRERLEVFQLPGVVRLLELPEVPAQALPAALAKVCREVAHTPERLKHVSTQLGNRLQDLDQRLGSHHRALQTQEDDLLLVDIASEEGRRPASIAAADLRERAREAEALLAEQERRVFEDTLLQALCSELHRGVRGAQQLVTEMDEQMQRRSMSSGVHFGVRWKPRDDLDPATQQVLAILRRDPTHLRGEQLVQVGEHLRRTIDAEARGEAVGYDALLRRALDYRAWHTFELRQGRAGEPMKTLTRRSYAQLSGGEKASASHCPLFAAAHAHFSAGSPFAPRLIALDEAFEGIDEHGRPELLALTAAFDLDLFLTGYDLWVDAPSIEGVAHYELEHSVADRLVTATRMVWRGGAVEYVDEGLVLQHVPGPA